MAYPLPTLDQFVNLPAYTPRPPAPEEPDPYEGLTPDQRAQADRRVALLMKQTTFAETAQCPR